MHIAQHIAQSRGRKMGREHKTKVGGKEVKRDWKTFLTLHYVTSSFHLMSADGNECWQNGDQQGMM